MVTVQEYSTMILEVEGVSQYLLMKTDGRILSHNVSDPDGLSSFMAVAGFSIVKIQESLGIHHFNHLLLKRANKENLILLKLGNILLGVMQKSNIACSEILTNLSRIQEKISVKNKAAT